MMEFAKVEQWHFILGERKRIYCKVKSKLSPLSYRIKNATYEITNMQNELISSGVCEVDQEQKTMSVLYEPKDVGRFIVKFSYEISKSNLINKAMIIVHK